MFAFFNDLKGSLIKFPEQFFKGCNIANDMLFIRKHNTSGDG